MKADTSGHHKKEELLYRWNRKKELSENLKEGGLGTRNN